MSETRDTYLLLRAFVDELVRCGVAGACTSPGSRSTPLVLSLARDGRLDCHSHVDERAAGFFAIGLARATGRPAVLACTSGTAAANYAPAVIEASEAGVPLIVLTADRPPELREVGAGQTIDQIKLYGGAAKWFVEVGTHVASPARLRWMRQLACRAVWAALDGRPGPVHLNIALREPLVLEEELGPPAGSVAEVGRADGAPWTTRGAVVHDPAPVTQWLRERRRGVIVAGGDGVGPAADGEHPVARLAEALAWPLLADPLSGARRGSAAIAYYDALLRDPAWAAGVRPECVLRIGDLPTSKPLRQWLADLDVPQAALAAPGSWPDPDGALTTVFDLPGSALAGIDEPWDGVDAAWLGTWREADARAGQALATTLGEALNEPRVARELATAVPSGARIVVASSMPIRDVETFWPVLADPPQALANRGANGIDGTISTAYGVAAAGAGPTYLLIGDVALAHDVGGMLAGTRLRPDLTIVVVDNAGGGIFDFLPVATQRDAFEEHVLTPTELDVDRIAALYGADYELVTDVAGLRAALAASPAGTRVLHVRTTRAENVRLHRRCWAAVTAALAPTPA